MRTLTILLATLLLAACKKVSYDKPEDRPPPRKRIPEPAQVVVPKRNPLYVILDTEPRNEYEARLPRALSTAMNAEALAQFCAQWYPDYRNAVTDAYREWKAKNQTTLDELVARNEAVWTVYAGDDVGYVKLVQPHLKKQLLNGITAEFDRSPYQKFQQICRDYPTQVQTPQWALEKRLKKDLAFLRKFPVTPG
jgi:hypothetical protein